MWLAESATIRQPPSFFQAPMCPHTLAIPSIRVVCSFRPHPSATMSVKRLNQPYSSILTAVADLICPFSSTLGADYSNYFNLSDPMAIISGNCSKESLMQHRVCHLSWASWLGVGDLFLRWWRPSTMWVGILIFECHHQGCLNNPIFSNMGLYAACWAHFMCHHKIQSVIISLFSIVLWPLLEENITKNYYPYLGTCHTNFAFSMLFLLYM